METKSSKANRSLEMEPSEEKKSFEVSVLAISTKGFETTSSGAEEKACLRKCSSMIKYNIEQKDAHKAINPGNRIELRSADQIDDKGPSMQFTRIDKRTFVQMEQKDQEACPAPSSIKLHVGFEASIRQDPASDIQEELLPEKTEQLFCKQDIRVQEKKTTEILNAEAEQSLAKDGKKTSSRERAQKEFHDSLKARAAELKQESTVLSQELRRHSIMCMQLIEDNKLLMDELLNRLRTGVPQRIQIKILKLVEDWRGTTVQEDS